MPGKLIRVSLLFILLILMEVLWRYLASSGFLTLERIKDWINQLGAVRSSLWMVPGIVIVYVVTLLLTFLKKLLVV